MLNVLLFGEKKVNSPSALLIINSKTANNKKARGIKIFVFPASLLISIYFSPLKVVVPLRV
jgi:hypothetical protein